MINKDVYTTLCVAQLALDGNSAATIDFFRKIVPLLLNEGGHVNGRIGGELAFMTVQGAGKHLHNLTRKGYLVRKNYRRWVLPDRFLKDRSLLHLSRFIYSDN